MPPIAPKPVRDILQILYVVCFWLEKDEIQNQTVGKIVIRDY